MPRCVCRCLRGRICSPQLNWQSYPLLKKLTSKADYEMSYIHPRDLDAEQPMIHDLSLARKCKSYFGLKQAKPKLEKWLNDFEFVDIEKANQQIDWNLVKTIHL